MRVVDHQPQAWLLFQEGKKLLLDVNCNHSAAGYSVLIPLSAEEEEAYSLQGRGSLDRLAQLVQESGPHSPMQSRDVGTEFGPACERAFAEWRASQE